MHLRVVHRPVPRQHGRHTAHAAATRAARGHVASRRALSCHASVVWRQLDRSKTWLAHPRSARTKGVVHFLGGAFAGAAPQLLYNSFIELLADAGYTVVATPYKVTFQHDVCARQVRQAFQDSIAELRATGRSYLAPPTAPQFGVGHSNGALLHLLINSYEPGATDSNVIISYNNLQVSDAIPIPGFLDSLQPTVQAARAANAARAESSSGSSSSGDTTTSSSSNSTAGKNEGSTGTSSTMSSTEEQLLAAAAATLPLAEQQQLLLAGAAPALEQLSSVVNEVGDGLTDFRPSPEESRSIIKAGYSCPATLLLQFANDNFDETPEMQQLLTSRQSGSSSGSSAAAAAPSGSSAGSSDAAAVLATSPASKSAPASGYTSAWNSIDEDVSMDDLLQQLQELQASLHQQEQQRQQQQQPTRVPMLQQMVLPGSHVTPCGAEFQPSLGPSPFDVLLNSTSGQSSQADLRNLAQQVLAFLEGNRQQATQRRAALQQQQQQSVSSSAGTNAASAGASSADAAGTPAVTEAVATP